MTKADSLKNNGGICGGCYGGLMGDKVKSKKPLSQTLWKVGERNDASPEDFTKGEAVKIANYSPQLEIKNVNRGFEKKFRNDQ